MTNRYLLPVLLFIIYRCSSPSCIVQFPVVRSTILPDDPSLERFKSPVYKFAQRLEVEPRSNRLSTAGNILPDVMVDPVIRSPLPDISNEPVITALPLNGNPTPEAAFKANDAVTALDADTAQDEVPKNDPL